MLLVRGLLFTTKFMIFLCITEQPGSSGHPQSQVRGCLGLKLPENKLIGLEFSLYFQNQKYCKVQLLKETKFRNGESLCVELSGTQKVVAN